MIHFIYFYFLSFFLNPLPSDFCEVHFFGEVHSRTVDVGETREGFDVKEKYFYKCENKKRAF